MQAKSEYAQKLKDPRWQKKRLEILSRDEWKCQHCADTQTTLHVHHKFYRKGAEPWEYEDAALITLCADCHEAVTAGEIERRDEERQLIELLRIHDIEAMDAHCLVGGERARHFSRGLAYAFRDSALVEFICNSCPSLQERAKA